MTQTVPSAPSSRSLGSGSQGNRDRPLRGCPSASCSMPSRVISASTAAATCFCAVSISARLSVRRADDVESAPGQHAGDRVEVGGIDVAADRAASNGIDPPPQNVSATFGRWPKRATPNCSTSSGKRSRIRAEMAVHVGPDRAQAIRPRRIPPAGAHASARSA